MIDPGAPTPLNELLAGLPAKFEEGKASGELLFFESSAEDVQVDGKRFNIRLCPALQDKAKAKDEALAKVRGGDSSPDANRQRRDESDGARPNGDGEAPQSKQNSTEPFKPPYVPELFAGSVKGLEGEADMSILTFQPQSVPPSPAQLGIAYQLLLASSRHPSRPRRLLAFYNSNPTAGASQPWRHIQFIETPASSTSTFGTPRAPVEEWCAGLDLGDASRRDRAVVHPGLPYVHVLHPLPYDRLREVDLESEEGEERLVDALAPAVMRCLDLAIDALRRVEGAGETGWNLIMTLEHLHLIPRLRPSFELPAPHSPLELNALGYAGYMLVKSQEEQSVLMDIANVQEGGLMGVLEKCGVPRALGQEAEEALDRVHNGGEMF